MEALQTINILILALTVGIFSILLARKLNIVPIVVLLIMGVIVGPEVLGLIHPKELGPSLEVLLQIGIAIILFEGALTLNYSEYKKVGGLIFKILSLGALITWIINALAIKLLFDFPITYAFFLSSIIVVTGPTVIMPILRRVNLKPTLSHILHWEGILIDPIGLFLATFTFEILISGGDQLFINGGDSFVLFRLFSRLGIGILLGGSLGYLGAIALNKQWVPQDMHNSFILMWALFVFGLANIILSEAGVLAVVIAGIVVGITRKVSIEEIKKFKFDLTEIFIAIIFILLSAEINFSNIKQFLPQGIILLLIITLVTRPLSIFCCTIKSSLKLREKLFLSWLAPRGIIATSMVTLFAFSLQNNTELSQDIRPHLWFMETFVFSVIAFTVIFQGLSAPLVAKLLKVSRDPTKNWVIVGAHALSEQVARYLMHFNKEVTLIDNNREKLKAYDRIGFTTIHGNSLAYDIFDKEPFVQAGRLLALTDNIDLNELVCQHWKKIIKRDGLYRWGTKEQNSGPHGDTPANNHIIWNNLAKPSILSEQIHRQERSFLIKAPHALTTSEKENAIPLMAIDEAGHVHFSPNINSLDDRILKRDWLFLAKGHFSIASFLHPEAIEVISPSPHTSEPIYKKALSILDHVFSKYSIEKKFSPEDTLTELQHLEKKRSVCIGHHVAIFPLLKKSFKEPIILLLKTQNGIKLNAYDNKPIQIFFFIFAHDADSMHYLSIISHISKIVTATDVRTSILKTTSSEPLRKLIYSTIEKKNI